MATHTHSHTHDHAPANFDKRFSIGIALNLGVVVLEVIYGLSSHSLALLSDAGHNATDVLALALAWIASVLVRRRPTTRRSGVWGRSVIAPRGRPVLFAANGHGPRSRRVLDRRSRNPGRAGARRSRRSQRARCSQGEGEDAKKVSSSAALRLVTNHHSARRNKQLLRK